MNGRCQGTYGHLTVRTVHGTYGHLTVGTEHTDQPTEIALIYIEIDYMRTV